MTRQEAASHLDAILALRERYASLPPEDRPDGQPDWQPEVPPLLAGQMVYVCRVCGDPLAITSYGGVCRECGRTRPMA